MHTLKITLKQHTPLIHFQHDQDGATLRASEVKPKLDRYILTRLGNGDYNSGKQQAKNNGWLVGKGEHPALDYKMRIVATGVIEEYLLVSYIKPEDRTRLEQSQILTIVSPYFAQEEQNRAIIRSNNPQREWANIDKKGILAIEPISMDVVSANTSLIQFLSENIQPFFLSCNFGSRQSKGFGCFSVEEIIVDNNRVELLAVEALLRSLFQFVYKKRSTINSLSGVFSAIKDDYQLLKSGRTRPYSKSKLMLYADKLDPQIGWDKKYIKVNTNNAFETPDEDCYRLLCREENRKSSYSPKRGYKYYRALLGLAEQFEFLLENPPHGDRKNKMIVKIKNGQIQRYQSPLLFKVINGVIYLVGNDVSEDMLDKRFDFLVTFQKDSLFIDEPVDEENPIHTPSVFSLKDFMGFAMNDATNDASLDYIKI